VVPQRISNFNDLDPLSAEPDVRLRLVRDVRELSPEGRAPDAVILPGSKNTIEDMRALRGAGFAAALRGLPETTRVIGICAGLQMLGLRVDDPLGLESAQKSADGFGLLPLATILERDKTLTRISATCLRTGQALSGYEIHHGQTDIVDSPGPRAVPLAQDASGRALSFGLDAAVGTAKKGKKSDLGATLPHGLPRVWGTYLHGVFDEDGFRRVFLDDLRRVKGLKPLLEPQTRFGLEPALERLAASLRQHLDMKRVYQALGLPRPGAGGLLG
jgi:cobyric acid synthase